MNGGLVGGLSYEIAFSKYAIGLGYELVKTRSSNVWIRFPTRRQGQT